MHKLRSFTALAAMTIVALTMLCRSDALAQERPLDTLLLSETPPPRERLLNESVRKDISSIVAALKENPLSVQIFDVMKYLEERRGKVPLMSALENKLHLELGLFGYLGVKWRF
jgi:hypothetical protein